jgi:trehalose/maltose hydrolase-like predicted phosphorylase
VNAVMGGGSPEPPLPDGGLTRGGAAARLVESVNRRFEDFAVEAFSLSYEGYEPDQEGLREVLTSSGNGRFCSRGAAEWEDADGVHYPGTYAHGVYNRETTILGGVPVLNEDLVNLPNWLVLKLRIEGEDAIRLGDLELLHYRHELDLRQAVTTRSVWLRDAEGRETKLCSRRFVSMAHPHSAAIEWTLVASNWSGRVEIVSAIDGRVTNRGVVRYLELEGRHLDPVSPRTFDTDVIALKILRQSICTSARQRTRVSSSASSPSRWNASAPNGGTISSGCSRSRLDQGRRSG